ncbi:MAG: START-like domain-containing protein [Bacteroidaceae bacterium]|nr:START-like domain-containing protein [Bacteroidaceae bacterium]
MATDKQIGSKEKVTLEYELSSQSIPMIWEAIATAAGLASWFADDAVSDGKLFTFTWGKSETRQAEMINCRQQAYVRFHWLDEVPGTYFEIRITKNELTQKCVLVITDFAEADYPAEARSLWDSSIDILRRCGL